MTYLFIADLHLSPDHPRLVRGFLDLLLDYQDKHTQLYILGDWFNAWIGDDYTAPWLDEIITALKAFTQTNNSVYFQVGNRDFALGQDFLNRFDGILLPDTFELNLNNQRIRLEHGDALCTDDLSYQRFRKIIRNPWVLGFLKRTPLSFRQKLANGFRKKSRDSNQFKSYQIMDVNQKAVELALTDSDLLIHGHTHQPKIHDVSGKSRIVLGDWREQYAEILVIDSTSDIQQLALQKWQY